MRLRLTALHYLLLCVLTLSYDVVVAYKFLAILQSASRSHFFVGSSLMKALAQKGHEVYVISPFPQKQPVDNYHDIPLPSMLPAVKGELIKTQIRNSLITIDTHLPDVDVPKEIVGFKAKEENNLIVFLDKVESTRREKGHDVGNGIPIKLNH